jgi:hypothetical protein
MAYTTIDDPSAHFQTALWTGTGSSQNITNDGNSDLKPDWVWIKERGQANNHKIYDSSRGTTKFLVSATTDAEGTDSNGLTAFLTDGFTLGGGGSHNANSNTYVGWQWKANGGTVANDTNGDITTSVQANQTAGFSIATYTGNGGSNQTLGHGLGAEPDFVIFKDRDSSSAWRIFVRLLGASKFLNLNTTDAASASTNIFPSHSSTTIGVEQNDVMNKSSSNHIMYSFRSIQGYSKIGSYTGNGNTDGAFVYTGFKPAWVMIKRTNSTQDWPIFDSKLRPSNNVDNYFLYANLSNSQDTSDQFDIVSNGFKLRMTSNLANGSGDTYIYMAFAEHPFVSSKGVPVTAR